MYARAKREIFLWGRVTYTYTIAKRKIFLGREGGGGKSRFMFEVKVEEKERERRTKRDDYRRQTVRRIAQALVNSGHLPSQHEAVGRRSLSVCMW